MEYTPKQIVAELDRFIIGQDNAKKQVAIALRNRYRRMQLTPEVRDEITPKNIIMKGPTGVGKTEIARRLAKIVKAPFIKVEATKFTEVGYVGRDVESMIRDLVEVSIRLVREEKINSIKPRIELEVEKEIIKQLVSLKKKDFPDMADDEISQKLLAKLRHGDLENETINIKVTPPPATIALGGGNPEINFNEVFSGLLGKNKQATRSVTVSDARKQLLDEKATQLLDMESIKAEALRKAEQEGIIFIDEIDKIASKGNQGIDVSREGVQRDILPIVEGSTVSTKYGLIKTDFILFIGAGAFHVSSVEDLIPELQGRFPIRVNLDSLTTEDFVKILAQTDNAILQQYAALLKVDKVSLKFTKEAIESIAQVAANENENNENLGARRLYGIMENLIEDISYNAGGLSDDVEVVIDKQYVYSHLEKCFKSQNLKKYII